MRVNKIFFITVFMCAFTTGIVNARTLHFGDKTIALSQTKYTTPSLAFGIGNETWYAPMILNSISNGLHIEYNNTKYLICEIPNQTLPENCSCVFTDTKNYTYDENGRLIGADENVYLQSTGTQYILTDFYVTTLSRAELIMKPTTIVLQDRLFGYAIAKGETTNTICAFAKFQTNTSVEFWANRVNSGGQKTFSVSNLINSKRKWMLDIKNRRASIGSQTGTLSRLSYTQPAQQPFGLFGATTPSNGVAKYTGGMYLYNTKLYEDDVLMRHFVPVPACMRIGNFVVPENGMWDIVNQQFYGNSGTGSFIYGKDE